MLVKNRIIGTYGGARPGPLLLVFGAIHGNEPAGPAAIQLLFELLEREAARRSDFVFSGKIIGLVGNLQAFQTGQRFLEKDLNRQWTTANVEAVLHSKIEDLRSEDLEMRQTLDLLKTEIEATQPLEIVLLDLHTTSAGGGIFVIPSNETGSLRLAARLRTPVIRGLLIGIEGTTMHFFTPENVEKYCGWRPTNFYHPISNLEIQSAGFEAGQHDDPDSISRAVAGIIHALRAVGCIAPTDLQSSHEAILEKYAAALPPISSLRHVHRIEAGDDFKMVAGFVNFQKIETGQLLAHDRRGPIFSPQNGRILMPLYQKQGSDGFFIVAEDEG